jgi:molybdopterin-guanine dinucleotide biosynthesis protein A
LKYSAIVLAGGSSKRLGQDKPLLMLGNKPLLLHVLHRVSTVVNEQIVVAKNEQQKNVFEKIVKDKTTVVVDEYQIQTPLAGAYTGFHHACNEYALLLSSDTPFVNTEIARLLLDICIHKTATIPRWPEGHIEPLQAAYQTKTALTAAKTALDAGELNMLSMLNRMRNVRYVSTIVLRQLDPNLHTFFNVNTEADLKKAETLLKIINHQKSRRERQW